MIRLGGFVWLMLAVFSNGGCSTDGPEYRKGYGWDNMPSDFRTKPYRPVYSPQ